MLSALKASKVGGEQRGPLSSRTRQSRDITPYMFLLPATVALLLVFFYPMLNGIYTSFTHYNQYTDTTRLVGLENYAKILRDPSFWNSMQRSVVWVVGSVVGQFVIGFVFALLLNERWPGNRIVRVMIMIPWIMPGVAVLRQ